MQNLKEKTLEHLANSGLSQNIFAKQIGVHPSYLSSYLNDAEGFKYKDKVEKTLSSYFENRIEKKESHALELPFMHTKDAKSIYSLIEFAIEDRDMAIIIGEAGTGKSRTVKEFSSKHPEVILIEATINTNSRSLFAIIANALNLAPSKSIDETIRRCAEYLKRVEKTIIIDESEHLPYRALEGIRRLYDLSQKTPLILVGTRKLYSNLTGGKNRNLEYQQLSSRVGGKFQANGLVYRVEKESGKVEIVDTDLRRVCECFGVIDSSLINLIATLSRGNFRKTEKLLRRSLRLAEFNECEINEEIIKEATKMLLL